MGDTTNTQGKNPEAKKELTAADAAKLVKRPVTKVVRDKEGAVVKDDAGQPKTATELVPVAAKEVLSFKDYGSHVVVVTRDGQKFSSAGAEE